jgi:PIN domain nuclease of toxin-antitoxin system
MIVIDTHVWVWWTSKPEKLPPKARRVLDKADRIGISAISVWEVAIKAQSGKLRFDRPFPVWIDEALGLDPRTELLPLLPRISVDAVQFSWRHSDPADRFIVATARAHHAPLVTADDRIRESGLVRCVWD